VIFGEDIHLHRLKWAFESCKNGAWGDEPDGEADAVCIRAADFEADLGLLNDGKRTLRFIDDETYRKVGLRAGDLIVEKSGGGEKQLVGRSVVYNGSDRAVCSNFLARCRPSSLATSEYLNYLLLGIYKARGTYPHIKQTTGIQNLDMASFLNTPVKLPVLETQKRIGAFLDEKTAQLDALIEKKRALLERLAEKRQAIITQAVTKGLNPAAAMKDSGIDWLGQIPAHWKVIALNKVTTKITNGYVGPTRDLFVGAGIRYLQSLHIKGNRIIFGDDFFVEKGWSDEHAKSILKAGDVLIVQTGDIGQVACVPPEYEGCNCHALIVCSPTGNRLDGRYLAWLFNSDYGQEFLHMVKTGALHPHLNCGNVKFFNVLVPPAAEQRKIADFVDDQRERMEIATRRVKGSVQRLTEYRAAIITAAVTGQIEGLR
jgi:type I restriction enzyme S subunit